MHRIVSLLACWLVGAIPAQAQLPKIFHATVDAVDAKLGTITVHLISTEKLEKPLTLNLLRADLPVTDALEQPMKVAELRPHDRIVVTMASDEDVGAIRHESDVLWGTAGRYDDATKTLVCRI